MSIPRIFGRSRELGALRTRFDAPEASWGWLVGPPGVGKTTTVRHAAADFHAVYHRAPPLSEPQQRTALAASLSSALPPQAVGAPDRLAGDTPSWSVVFEELVHHAPRDRPSVLVVDDAHRWTEARARFAPALAHAMALARRLGKALHVVLVAPEVPPRGADEDDAVATLHLEPLTFEGAAALLPGAATVDRLRAYATFGGLPGVLAHLDRDASLGTNIRRLVLAPHAPLQSFPLTWLEQVFQTPTRYASILTALAPEEGDWGVVHDGVPDLTASGQAGPYLKRLEEIGLLEVRRSLDASPRTRSRRYRITDPFVAFWFRFILPHRHLFAEERGESLYAEVIRPGLPDQTASVLPQVCRDFMAGAALAHLGVHAREVGSLWGGGYELPVAGVLTNGVPFYGHTFWDAPPGPGVWDALDQQIRETRYGFGRELRLRIVFTGDEIPATVQREAARRHDAVVIGVDALTDSG